MAGNGSTYVPARRAGGTHVAKILPGLISYAQASWTDNDYPFPNLGSGIVKAAYPNVAGFTEAVGGTGLAAMWITYTNQINLGHPVEVSFDRWVGADTGGTVSVNGQTVHEWSWASSVEYLGHSVVGVGYFTDAQTNKWFICQDGLSATQQYVAVPVDAKWVENDYITAVPEPTTFVLLLVGTVSALIYGWRVTGWRSSDQATDWGLLMSRNGAKRNRTAACCPLPCPHKKRPLPAFQQRRDLLAALLQAGLARAGAARAFPGRG